MDSYETIEEIGHGADGVVYKVVDVERKKFYAMKVVRLNEKSKMRNSKTIADEAKLLSKLKHPHIVAYHDAFFTDNSTSYCLILDLCDGGTMEQKIQDAVANAKTFQENEIMHWFVQLVSAVQYLHSQKILHRDLKAQNVFLTRKNIVKLGDFGISKCLTDTMDLATTCCGTPCYISPELCQDQPYSSKADVWALGCLLYEMCALEPAFTANNPLSLIFKIVKADYLPLSSRFSDDLRGLVAQLLSKQVDQRPSSLSLLADAFMKQHMTRFVQFSEQQKASKLARKQAQLSTTATSDEPSAVDAAAGEEEYEDDFEEVEETEAAARTSSDEGRESEEEYEDDFEECSSLGDYDDLLNTAKEACDLELQVLHTFDGDSDDDLALAEVTQLTGFECRDRLREECLRVLQDSKCESELKQACRGIMEEVG